jgi:hypothetical protein
MVTPAPTYPTYQAAVLADNPIHYYPLNETSGSIATDLGSLTSGGATYTGGFSLGQPPISPSIVGTSVHLDGNAGTFVDCGQIYPGTSASVEAWVQLDSGARANFNSFLCRFDGCFEADFNTTDHIGFIARNNSNVLGQAYMPTTSARAVWHHVVGTFDTNGVVTVYVDGVQGAAAALGGTLQNAGPTPDRVLIGATRNGSASSFNWLGYLGQVAIYDHALSAVAVRVHYATSGALSSKPVITSQPIGGTVTAGNDFTFNVGYIGTTTSIQWFKNGVAIPGATNSSYPIIFARTNNSGTYQVVLGNYVGSTNSATAVLTVTPAPTYTNYQAAVLADNPVNYYPLNETSGTTATDLGSIPSPGTYSGGFTLGQPSSIGLGNCVHFDGQPGTFVNCGFIYPGLSASVEAWVNLDSSAPNTYQAIVARWSGSFELDLNSSGIGGINAFNDSNTGGSAYMPTAATRGVWHHLVGVFDTNGVLTIYVDGAKGAATTLGGGLQNSGPLDDVTRIGATRDGVTPPNSFNFQGYIAQVAIYDHALSAASIRAHYITSQLQSSPQLVTINQESGMEVLSWAAYPIGYFLQYANSLSGPYQTYTGLISRIGTNSVAVVPSGLFYRLTK